MSREAEHLMRKFAFWWANKNRIAIVEGLSLYPAVADATEIGWFDFFIVAAPLEGTFLRTRLFGRDTEGRWIPLAGVRFSTQGSGLAPAATHDSTRTVALNISTSLGPIPGAMTLNVNTSGFPTVPLGAVISTC